MELYEAINKRKTTREFLEKPVDFEVIKRILRAGNKAPTWDHNRNWQFIVLRTAAEKEYAFSEAKALADKFNADRYLNMPRPYPITLGQKMYGYAMPKQYTMLKDAPYVIIPLFKSKELNGEYKSKKVQPGKNNCLFSPQLTSPPKKYAQKTRKPPHT